MSSEDNFAMWRLSPQAMLTSLAVPMRTSTILSAARLAIVFQKALSNIRSGREVCWSNVF